MAPTTVHPELPLEDEHLRATLAVVEQRRDEVGHYEAWGPSSYYYSAMLHRHRVPLRLGSADPGAARAT